MSKRLIKDGDIVLDGTLPRYAKEKQAFEKLEVLEGDEEELHLEDLHRFLQCLEPNTLFRIMPYEKAKVIDDFRRGFTSKKGTKK